MALRPSRTSGGISSKKSTGAQWRIRHFMALYRVPSRTTRIVDVTSLTMAGRASAGGLGTSIGESSIRMVSAPLRYQVSPCW